MAMTAVAILLFLINSVVTVLRQELSIPSRGTQVMGLVVSQSLLLQRAQGSTAGEPGSHDNSPNGALRTDLTDDGPFEKYEVLAPLSRQDQPEAARSAGLDNNELQDSNHLKDHGNPVGTSGWYLGSNYQPVSQWRRTSFLLVTVADDAMLSHLIERRERRLPVLSFGGETRGNANLKNQKARKQRYPAADGDGQPTGGASRDSPGGASAPPITVRLSSPLWLASFSMSQATCLGGGAYVISTVLEARFIEGVLYVAPSPESLKVRRFWLKKKWMRGLDTRRAGRADGPLFFLPLNNNLLASSITRLDNDKAKRFSDKAESISKTYPREGDDVILICPNPGDSVIVISGPIASPLFLDDQPESLADQTLIVTDGWRQLAKPSWGERNDAEPTARASNINEVALVLQTKPMPNLLSPVGDGSTDGPRDSPSDKLSVQSGNFFFLQAIERTTTLLGGDRMWLTGPRLPLLNCFLDVIRGADVTTGKPCASRSCETLVLRCQRQRKVLRVSSTGVGQAGLFKQWLYRLLIAVVVSLFVAPLGTVAGHSLASSSPYFDYVWSQMDHGLTERNPLVCPTFQHFTNGELGRWFAAARWLNILRSATHVTTDVRVAAGLCCGGLSFRLGQIAGRLIRWLIAAVAIEKATSKASEFYRILTRRVLVPSSVEQPAGRPGVSRVVRQVLGSRSSDNGESVTVTRGAFPRTADIPSHESFISAWREEAKLRDSFEQCNTCSSSPVVIYCLGLENALRQHRERRHGGEEQEARKDDSPVETRVTVPAPKADKMPLSPGIVLVAVESKAAQFDIQDLRPQGKVHLLSRFGTAWLAPKWARAGPTRSAARGKPTEAKGYGSVSAGVHVDRSTGAGIKSCTQETVTDTAAGDTQKHRHVTWPREALRVRQSGMGQLACLDQSAFAVGSVKAWETDGGVDRVALQPGSLEMETRADDRARKDRAHRAGNEHVLIPVSTNLISARKGTVRQTTREVNNNTAADEQEQDHRTVKKTGLIVLLCLRRGSDVVAVLPDHAAFLSASQKNAPWEKQVFIEKTWAPAQNSNWTGYSLNLLFREAAPQARKACMDCRDNLPEMRPLQLQTNFYFANLSIPQASSSSSSAYALAFSYLIKYRYCKLSKALNKEQDSGTREKTREEIFLKGVEMPSQPLDKENNLERFAMSLGEQATKVTITTGGALIAIAAVALMGYRMARKPYLPALPAPSPRQQKQTASRPSSARSFTEKWKGTYTSWRRKYEAWTDVRRAVYTATRPYGRAGRGYLLGALATKLGVFVGKMLLLSVLSLPATRLFRRWARRVDSRAALQKRRQLVQSRKRSRSHALTARKAETESAANIVVYCVGLEHELRKAVSDERKSRKS